MIENEANTHLNKFYLINQFRKALSTFDIVIAESLLMQVDFYSIC